MNNELITLFISSFISATIAPGGSEALFVYLLNQGSSAGYLLLFAATAGNSLGGFVTYFMGYFFPVKRRKLKRRYPRSWLLTRRYGSYILLLSWLPVIGDILVIFAGCLRINIIWSFIAICIGKFLRYAFLLNFTLI